MSPSLVLHCRSLRTAKREISTSLLSKYRLHSSSAPVGPGGAIHDDAPGRHPRHSDRRRRKRDLRRNPGRPRALELPRRSGRSFGFSQRRLNDNYFSEVDVVFVDVCLLPCVSSRTTTHARHDAPSRCAFLATPHSLARRIVPSFSSSHLMYILTKSATAWSSASAPATSTVCFAFIAACITAWCDLSAST